MSEVNEESTKISIKSSNSDQPNRLRPESNGNQLDDGGYRQAKTIDKDYTPNRSYCKWLYIFLVVLVLFGAFNLVWFIKLRNSGEQIKTERSKIQEADSKILENENKIQASEKTLADFKNTLENKEKELKTEQDKILEANANITNINSALKVKEFQLQIAENNITESQNLLAALQLNLTEKENQLKEEIERIKLANTSVANYSEVLKAKEQELFDAQNLLNLTQSNLSFYEQNLTHFQRNLTQFQLNLTLLQGNLTELQKSLKRKEKELKQYDKDIQQKMKNIQDTKTTDKKLLQSELAKQKTQLEFQHRQQLEKELKLQQYKLTQQKLELQNQLQSQLQKQIQKIRDQSNQNYQNVIQDILKAPSDQNALLAKKGGDTLAQMKKSFIPESILNENIVKVTNKIYFGNKAGALELDFLVNEDIKYVLSTVGNIVHPSDVEYGIKRKAVDLVVTPNFNYIRYFIECIRFIDLVPRVYIHCDKGDTNAPTIVIAFLMWKTHSYFLDAYDFVKERKNSIKPNSRQLMLFEMMLQKYNFDLNTIYDHASGAQNDKNDKDDNNHKKNKK